ncbi:MAG TPA: hypothetical protein VNH11_25785 [Pirellulales bacterium]|nr:hypothetical protein [Pirellulales bacterium]
MAVPLSTNRFVSVEPSPVVLPLENGDHLTRAEFERRYMAMLRGDKRQVKAVAESGLASAAHVRFVAALEKRLRRTEFQRKPREH